MDGNLIPRTHRKSWGSPAWAPELLAKPDLLHCLITLEWLILELGLCLPH